MSEEAIIQLANSIIQKEDTWWSQYCQLETKISDNLENGKLKHESIAIFLSRIIAQLDKKLKEKQEDNEILIALFHKKRADILHYFNKNEIILPLMNKDLPWNKIYLFLNCFEELDQDIKSCIIKVLVSLVKSQIKFSTKSECNRSYETSLSYCSFVDRPVFEMQLRLDFGKYLYESEQFGSAMTTLSSAFEYSLTNQPWKGQDSQTTKKCLAILQNMNLLLTQWVKESKEKSKIEEEYI